MSCFAFFTGVTKGIFRKDLLRAWCMQSCSPGLAKQREFTVWPWGCIFTWKHYKTTWNLLFVASNYYGRTENRTTGKQCGWIKEGIIKEVMFKLYLERASRVDEWFKGSVCIWNSMQQRRRAMLGDYNRWLLLEVIDIYIHTHAHTHTRLRKRCKAQVIS